MPILKEDERLDRVNEQIELISKTDGLTFGTDAYLLAAFMRPDPRGMAVELGTGTGIIAMLCAARKRFASIYALEIQEDFAELAARNVCHNHMEKNVFVRHADIREVRAEELGREAEVVFANPPYMREGSGKRNESDRKYMARHEVCGGIDDFCRAAERLLKYGGKFYCVWRPDRLSELMEAMTAHHLEPKTMIFVHAHEEAEPSMVLCSAIRGGAPGMRILPPLMLHETKGSMALTERAAEIYATMSFYRAGEKGEN